MKKLLFFALIALVPFFGNAQKVKYVELDKNAPVYKTAKISSVKLNTDLKGYFEGFAMKGQALYPFAQQVLSTKGSWYQLPLGWVQKKYAKPIANKAIPENVFKKHFVGSLMDPSIKKKKGNGGLAIEYDLYCMRVDENSDDVIVFLHRFHESGIICTAKLSDNLIKCDKFIHVKDAKLDKNLEDFKFTICREKGGLKMYTINFGNRLNTVVYEPIIDVSSDGFDPEKLTTKDLMLMYQNIGKIGMPTKLCISVNTFENLEEKQYD